MCQLTLTTCLAPILSQYLTQWVKTVVKSVKKSILLVALLLNWGKLGLGTPLGSNLCYLAMIHFKHIPRGKVGGFEIFHCKHTHFSEF